MKLPKEYKKLWKLFCLYKCLRKKMLRKFGYGPETEVVKEVVEEVKPKAKKKTSKKKSD